MIVFMNGIPLHLLSKYFGPSFKFHSNLHFERKLLKDFPSFYKQILMNWKKKNYGTSYNTFLRFKPVFMDSSYIKIHNRAVYLSSFSANNINFITQLFHSDDSVKNWNIFKTEYALQHRDHYCRLYLINALPQM